MSILYYSLFIFQYIVDQAKNQINSQYYHTTTIKRLKPPHMRSKTSQATGHQVFNPITKATNIPQIHTHNRYKIPLAEP